MASFEYIITANDSDNWWTNIRQTITSLSTDLNSLNLDENQQFAIIIETSKQEAESEFIFTKGVEQSESIDQFIGLHILIQSNTSPSTTPSRDTIASYSLKYDGNTTLSVQILPEGIYTYDYAIAIDKQYSDDFFDITYYLDTDSESGGDEEKEIKYSQTVLFSRDKTMTDYVPFSWDDDTEATVVETAFKQAMENAHPIGSLFMTLTDNHPNDIMHTEQWGWQWVRISNSFIWAAGDDTDSGLYSNIPPKSIIDGVIPAQAGTPNTVLPIHTHSITTNSASTTQTTSSIKLEHSHQPAIVDNQNYTYRKQGAWVGIVPANGISQAAANAVANDGLGQQNYATTKTSGTIKGSFPKSKHPAAQADFFRGANTNTVSQTHSHTVTIPSITSTADNTGVSLKGNENMPPYIAAYIWVRIENAQ